MFCSFLRSIGGISDLDALAAIAETCQPFMELDSQDTQQATQDMTQRSETASQSLLPRIPFGDIELPIASMPALAHCKAPVDLESSQCTQTLRTSNDNKNRVKPVRQPDTTLTSILVQMRRAPIATQYRSINRRVTFQEMSKTALPGGTDKQKRRLLFSYQFP